MTAQEQAKALDEAITTLVRVANVKDATLEAIRDDIRETCEPEVTELLDQL